MALLVDSDLLIDVERGIGTQTANELLWSDLTERGQAIGAHDLWIAATAAAHGLGVATRNIADFQRVAGLRVVGAS